MAGIIKRSGLSAGAIYTHFSGKADIIAYVAQSTIDQVLGGVRQNLTASPPPGPDRLLERIIQSIQATQIGTGLIVQLWAEAVTNPEFQATANQIFGRVRSAMASHLELWLAAEEGLGQAEAKAAAWPRSRVLLSLTVGYIVQSALLDGFDSAAYTQEVAPALDA
jgi:AcrR family transcriptional regulator